MLVPGLIRDGKRAVQFVGEFRIMTLRVQITVEEQLLIGKLLLHAEQEVGWPANLETSPADFC